MDVGQRSSELKAILEFDLPEDREDFHGASHAWDFWNCLSEFDSHLRGLQKYAPDFGEKEQELVDQLREKFWNILRENNITLEEYS